MNKFQRWKNIMKCYPFEEKRLLKWEPPFICQPKFDGIRCRAVPLDNGEYILLSSEENILYSVPHINKELANSTLPRWEYDGELYCHGMSFEQITSITSRTVNLHYQHEMIKLHVFDKVDESQPQHSRLSDLIGQKYEFKKLKYLEFSPFWIVDNLEEVMKVYDKLISMDYEGIIVRHCEAPYVRKRSTFVMKFKPKKEDEYVICGYEEEQTVAGVPKGTLGALVLLSGNGEDTFKVGTGFTDEQRDLLWQSRERLCGKTCKIAYQHLTSGKKVPRFPVFVNILSKEKEDE